MGNEVCAAEKTVPDPLLAFQGTQREQNGKTRVVTIPEQSGRRSSTGATGLLAGLESQARRWAGLSLVLNLVLLILLLIFILITIIVLTARPAKTSEPSPTGAAYLVTACSDGWIEYWEKCYYFSEAEANWPDSQNHCSALGASLAGIDSQQGMDFLKRYKDSSDYWIGLQRDLDQPWKFSNGSDFNSWFSIAGGEQCAFLNSAGVASSRCSREGRWICSKPVAKTEGRAK